MAFKAIERPEHDLVITVPHGVITNDQLPAYYAERLEQGTLHPGVRELVDARNVGEFAVDAKGQRALVELLRDHADQLEGVRWAFIASSSLAFGMFRMFEAQKGELPFTTSVFHTVADAAEWLDVPVSAISDAAPPDGESDGSDG